MNLLWAEVFDLVDLYEVESNYGNEVSWAASCMQDLISVTSEVI